MCRPRGNGPGSVVTLLALRGIGKRYGAVRALHGIDLDVAPGEVLGICGDNGAGKSTLLKIVSGAQSPDAGTMRLRGEPLRLASPRAALARGIATIYQDLALAPDLPVYQNIFMGAELTRATPLPGLRVLDKAAMRRQASRYLTELGVSLPDVRRPVRDLSGGQRQAVAIARALRWSASLVIMDEPTAALGVAETARVLALIRRLNEVGRTVILVSHNMDDVVAVCQRVVILKKGEKAMERDLAGVDAHRLAHWVMTGRG